MQKIVLKSLTTSHQKILLYGFFMMFFFVGISTIFWYIAYFLDQPVNEEPYTFSDIIVALLFILSIFLLGIALSKEGFMIAENKLVKAIFLFQRPIKSVPIDLSEYTDVSIMGYNMSQKYAFGSAPNPDQTHDYKEYRVYLLNERHSKKFLLTSLKDSKKAKDLTTQLEATIGLKNTRYNPPISKKTMRRRR